MSRIVGIGAEPVLAGYGLVGVEVIDADEAESVRRAWAALADDVGLVLLTPAARRALPEPIPAGGPLWVVLPA